MDSPKPRRLERHGGILWRSANDSEDEPMKQLTATQSETTLTTCTAMAVDLAKRVFQIAAENALGEVLFEKRIKSREAFAAFLRRLPPGLGVLMEIGPGAQAWAPQLAEQGRPPAAAGQWMFRQPRPRKESA
jgi:hypothetical protein